MEEKLKSAIEKDLINLEKQKKEIEQELKKKQEDYIVEELKNDNEKIDAEIEVKQEEKEQLNNTLKDKETKTEENNKLNATFIKLLNQRKQIKEALKSIENKRDMQNGKLVKTNEEIEYSEDFKKINVEIKDIDKKLNKNKKIIDASDKKIKELREKYKIKDKDTEKKENTEQENTKQEKTKDNKFQPPAERDNSFQSPAERDNSFQSPAVVEKEKPKDPPVKENKKIRSFWEIYNSTCTEHCGTIPRTIHYLAKAPLFKMKGEDTVEKILSSVLNVVTVLPKVIAKPINKVMKVDDKFNSMMENLGQLSKDEFRILTESPESVNRGRVKPIKDISDRDYLNPNFMKQCKVNNLYLDAVENIYVKQRQEEVGNLNQNVAQINEVLNKLNEKEGKVGLSQEEKEQFDYLRTLKDAVIERGIGTSNEAETFRTGAKKKGSGFRNISGWILGKYNPNNKEQNQKMAELAARRREAAEKGDRHEVAKISEEIDNAKAEATNIKQIGKNERNLLDRGAYSYNVDAPVELLDKGEQTKTRKAITTFVIGTTLFKGIKDAMTVSAHNKQLEAVNAQNSKIEVNGQVKVTDQNTINGAATDYANTKIAGGHGLGEYGNLDAGSGATQGWSSRMNTEDYINADNALHQATAGTSNHVAQTASAVDKVKIGGEFYKNIADNVKPVFENASSVGKFDYSGILQSIANSDYSAMQKLFTDIGDGMVNYSDVVSGTMAELIENDPVLINTIIGTVIVKAAGDQAKDAKGNWKDTIINKQQQKQEQKEEKNKEEEKKQEKEQEDEEITQ